MTGQVTGHDRTGDRATDRAGDRASDQAWTGPGDRAGPRAPFFLRTLAVVDWTLHEPSKHRGFQLSEQTRLTETRPLWPIWCQQSNRI